MGFFVRSRILVVSGEIIVSEHFTAKKLPLYQDLINGRNCSIKICVEKVVEQNFMLKTRGLERKKWMSKVHWSQVEPQVTASEN